jgi:hypothetical protein
VSKRGLAKLSQRLAEQLDAVDGSSEVEVIVELQPVRPPATGSRQERIAAMKERFERELGPVAEKIEQAGGSVVETAWLNQTIRGRIPAGEVPNVAEDDVVSAIDLPRRLEPDAQPPTQTRPAP